MSGGFVPSCWQGLASPGCQRHHAGDLTGRGAAGFAVGGPGQGRALALPRCGPAGARCTAVHRAAAAGYPSGSHCGFDALEQHDAEGDPLHWLLSTERRRLVREALAELSGKDAEILLLKYTEDWSYRQLAEHLGTSCSAVESRLHRARAKLRSALRMRDFGRHEPPVESAKPGTGDRHLSGREMTKAE